MNDDFIPNILKNKDIYRILDISINDINNLNIKNIIRKQYLKKALKLHPDKNKTNEKTDDFNLLKSAYEFLLNKNLRERYNLYIEKKIKERKKENTSLNRYIEQNKKKYLIEKNRKKLYKEKLEQKEKQYFDINKKENLNKKEKLNEKDELNKIKKSNEIFMKKQTELEKKIQNDKNKQIDIYIKDYSKNINILKDYITNKKFYYFFYSKFNVHKYDLYINEKDNEKIKKVGYIIFENRIDTINSYIYYKKNITNFDKNFKLKLTISNENKKTEEMKNVDEIINNMENELDKYFL